MVAHPENGPTAECFLSKVDSSDYPLQDATTTSNGRDWYDKGGGSGVGGSGPNNDKEIYDCTTGGKYGIADDHTGDARRVRVAFRTGKDDTNCAVSGAKHASTGTTGCNKFGDKQKTGHNFNATTGTLTISDRGGYEGAMTVDVKGPGTLYVTHMDMNQETDYILVTDKAGTDHDFKSVKLTGNYSACVRQAGLEKLYTDKNLAPGSAEGGSGGGVTRTSTHDTEETQNHQSPQGSAGDNQLCHDVLTGKLLGPQPITCKEECTIAKVGGSDTYKETNFADGYTLQYVYDDWYYADMTPSGDTETLSDCTVDTPNTGSGAGALSPSDAPTDAYFVDEDLSRMAISGKMYANGGGPKYSVILEKVLQPGAWGFLLDDNAISFGPRDTWGHKSSTLPYYASGGSTGTDAPSNLLDQGNGDSGDADQSTQRGSGQQSNTGQHATPNPGQNDGTGTPTSAGGPLDHAGSGGLINTAGGGPAGARVFNKHGDVIPGSARGMHPDYWAEEVTEVKTWGPSTSPVTVGNARLEKSEGSPPSPMYRFQVVSCSDDGGCASKRRSSFTLQVVDIGMKEPAGTFYGDLDPKTRVLQGEITVVTPAYAMGIQGYRLYPTSDGDTNLNLVWSDNMGTRTQQAQLMEELAKSCPPDTRNSDWAKYKEGGTAPNAEWFRLASEPCGNDNPYSPKCRGKSCTHINILPGSGGEFYISRYDNYGNQENPQTKHSSDKDAQSGKNSNLPQQYQSNTGQRNYSDNEWAQIYLPRAGWLTPIMMDAPDADDKLELKKSPGASAIDLKAKTLSEYIDIYEDESVIEWTTDLYGTGHGFTLIFQPDYPEVEFLGGSSVSSPTQGTGSKVGLPMADGASGYRIVTVYGAKDAAAFTVDHNADRENTGAPVYSTDRNTEYRNGNGRSDQDADTYVETMDWLVPNVTCTPTTMHCPLPSTWAHINYTTPSLYPEPAEGSCLQQKTGTSSLSGCSEKMNLNTRWYSANSPTTKLPGNSQQNNEEEDNGQGVAADTYSQKHRNWAGNCGDATSYFWFEKIACGSSRTFLTDRSLIEDFVQLTPTWEDIQAILDLYYTTKAPLQGAADGDKMTFITADYHIPPVLPPKVNCTCLAAMDAYASLLSVVSKTPSPGAPVTLDPEVLNTGTSKMVATMRAYQDPTYSIPASATVNMPIVVTRFYLEVSTKFTRNRITISDCTAASQQDRLNQSNAVKPRLNYCDNSTFDTQPEFPPNGVTHMDRLSMKKFKFQSTTDVFLQCKIRACAQQPCGECTGLGNPRQLKNVDLSPVDGEMFAPPTQVKVSMRDRNAMVFADTAYSAEQNSMYGSGSSSGISAAGSSASEDATTSTSSSGANGATTKPVEVSSELTLASVSAAWALENRAALAATLRGTLSLLPSEDLVITSISQARQLQPNQRSLQSSQGVKVEFTVGLSDPQRVQVSQQTLTNLASGSSPQLLSVFSQKLDAQLELRGKPKLQLSPASFVFAQPVTKQKQVSPSASGANFPATSYGTYNQQGQQTQQNTSSKTESSSGASGLVVVLFVAVGIALAVYLIGAKKASPNTDGAAGAPDAYASKIAEFGFDEAEQQPVH
jgi:hypothetical protein